MIRAHQPGSQPLDIPEAIPNPAVPRTVPNPSPRPSDPVKVPVPQRACRMHRALAPFGEPDNYASDFHHHPCVH
jgi:hypothetical protein